MFTITYIVNKHLTIYCLLTGIHNFNNILFINRFGVKIQLNNRRNGWHYNVLNNW